jgi:hypothetical protein
MSANASAANAIPAGRSSGATAATTLALTPSSDR